MKSSDATFHESIAGDILVVDDTPANLRLLSGMLNGQGYKVRSAPNGKLALMSARAAPPDLVLLDINMPGMSGYDVCTELKADPQTRDIPVIFISALDQTEDKIKAFQLGGVDYVTKPFQVEEVLARVKTHLTLHHLRCQLEAANAELRATVAALEISNADLNAFAHTVAHDLKNPLSVLIGFSSLTKNRFNDMDPGTVAENLTRINETGYKMRDIVNELLLLASVREMDEVQTGPLDMGALVNAALQRLEPQIRERQAEVSVPEMWPTARGYAAWIEEVWVNYVSNALKYGGKPPCVQLGASEVRGDAVTLRTAPPVALRISPIDTPESKLVFWVGDNGDGIAPEAHEKIFAPFTRLDQARASGHGLGLSIVRRIVEKLGGEVGVESGGEPGMGCAFWFTLPR